jgi:thiol-disulfide isomerase/thioredoxin
MSRGCRVRLAVGLAAVMASSVVVAASAVADEPPSTLAQQVAAIAKQNEELEQWFRTELRSAKQDHEKVLKANRDYQERKRAFADELKPLIKEHAARPEAFDAVLLLVGQVRYFLDNQEADLVLEHHLAHPKMGELCFLLRSRGDEPWAKRIITVAAQKHPSELVRGQATFALADALRSVALNPFREVTVERKEALLAEAANHYQTAVDQYAGTPTPDGKTTLGEKARHELARIKNLPNLEVGRPAPPIEGEDLDRQPLRLEDFRGKVVLLVFWGSWCGPCMAMVPHERELFERHRDKPFVLLGVNCGDPLEKAQATVKEKEMAWRHWYDGEQIRGPIQTHYNVPHWPRIFVIDKQGLIRGIDPEGEQLDELIEKALTES